MTGILNVLPTQTSDEDRRAAPLRDVPENHDHDDVQPQRLSGRRLHDTDDVRLRHLFRKAGAVAEHLYMDCNAGMVRLVTMVGIIVVICVALYHLCGAIIYALVQVEDMVY